MIQLTKNTRMSWCKIKFGALRVCHPVNQLHLYFGFFKIWTFIEAPCTDTQSHKCDATQALKRQFERYPND